MHLKSLSINGFKSFAKKSELEFTTSITGIVGPNGSGKSNVAEAFRFVLGEQSIKSMRGKKGEDLIFNGATGTARANRASVAIALDNQEHGGARPFPLDFDEITVERVVHRDGVNEYTLNGSRARLKDVQELLAAANIGSTGHHIISQGEADRILTASPKERREMIEDALGLKVYQYKKAESERKLAKTLENITRVESLRKEVKPHLTFLERQVKKMEKSVALQEDLKGVYAEYLKREDVYLAFHQDRLRDEGCAPVARKEELVQKLTTAKERLQNDEKDGKREALMALEKDMADVRARRHEAVHLSGQLEGQITFLARRIDDASRQEPVSVSNVPYADVEEAVQAIERSVESAVRSDQVSHLQRALCDVVGALKVLLKRSQTTPDTLNHTEKDKTELAKLKSEKESADRVVVSIDAEEGVLQGRYEELKKSIEEEHSESREAEREVFAIMNEQREIEYALQAMDAEVRILERDREEFKRELQEAGTLIGSAATGYFEYVVQDDAGHALTKEQIAHEERKVQSERRRALEKMKIRLEELGVGRNEEVLKEYKDVKERDEFLVREVADLEASVEKLEALIADLTAQLNEQFLAGIEKISSEFERLFMLMFGGGKAVLVRVKPKLRKKKGDEFGEDDMALEDEEEEQNAQEGIEIDVQLPNKRVRGLEMLSGGERALTSIALIFAMSQVNPPLFVILDETDAALDEANSRRYGDMITALAERSQLILITHNRETMGRAGVLYGVTMGGDGVSKLLSVKFDEAVAVAK